MTWTEKQPKEARNATVYDFDERVLVLGAREGSNNIGDAIVEELLHKGFTVTADDCEEWPNVYDVNQETIDRANPDHLVITLGKTAMKPFWEADDMNLLEVLTGSLILPLLSARYFVEHIKQKHTATYPERPTRLILIGSYAHRHPFTNGTAYCISKAGIDMMGKALGWELTDKRFRVHVVHPFHVQGTPMWEEVELGVQETKRLSPAEADRYNRKDLKMPDLCTPQEVAQVVRVLLTEEAMGWLSGTNIEMFGGTR